MLSSFPISLLEPAVLSRCCPEGTWCEAALRMIACKIFCSACLQSLYCIGHSFPFFRLMLERCCIGLIVTFICKLMRIGRWSEPRFVFVCQLVEVIREADATEISWELGLILPGNIVGESQLKIPKLEPDTILSNIVPLESVELEYYNEW